MVVNIISIEITTKTMDAKTKPFYNFKSNAKITLDIKLEVSLKDKVYPKIYYHHTLGQVQVYETPTNV
jgi:hypothetical protein